MRTRVGARTDIGRGRERNDDSYLVQDPLYAVADGMGGHPHGDVASALAIDIVKETELSDEPPVASLVDRIKHANTRLIEEGAADRRLRGMGTTLTAFLTDDDKGYLAHVGDSRAYLLRDGSLQQLTEDHTLVQRMVREGKLSPEEAETHPQRSILTNTLGVDGDIEVEQLTMDLHAGDRVVLCTDGLTTMVSRERIQRILEEIDDPDDAAERLVEEANRAGGDDNITVVIVDVLSDDGAPVARSTTASSRAVAADDGEPPERRREPLTGVMARPVGSLEEPDDGDNEQEGGPPPRRRRARWVRVVTWLVVLGALIAAAVVGARLYIERQWYVGDDGGRVAVFNGIPAKVLGVELSHVVERTELSATQAERLPLYRDLPKGITASSRQDADGIVQQIREDLSTSGGP